LVVSFDPVDNHRPSLRPALGRRAAPAYFHPFGVEAQAPMLDFLEMEGCWPIGGVA